MKKAYYYCKKSDNIVQCTLCPNFCLIKENQFGICKSRKNINGELIVTNYGEMASIALDPIEKKPLYNFYPGSKILSLGANGCNLKCKFCQNWQISQVKAPTQFISSDDLINVALAKKSIGIAFTYTEPTIWYEYIYDTAKKIKEEKIDLKIVLVTNGYINLEPFEELSKYIDAMNIDLKSINENFYKEMCNGQLLPVKKIIEKSYEKGIHIEITNLLITDKNDDIREIEQLVDYLYSISEYIPIHFSRYYPQYELNLPPTSEDKLYKAYNLAIKKMKYVYLGNILSRIGTNTNCYVCGNELINREYYNAKIIGITKDNKCLKCGEKIKNLIVLL